MNKVEIYTDGACIGNPGPGGWAALLRDAAGREWKVTGGAPDTTNNRMEMMGAIAALESLSVPSEVTLYSDSQYVVKGMNEWIAGWMRKEFRGVANADLWQRLHAARLQHAVSFHWVRGHAGNPDNERVDTLARRSAVSASRSTVNNQ